jgi:hypothetical protein
MFVSSLTTRIFPQPIHTSASTFSSLYTFPHTQWTDGGSGVGQDNITRPPLTVGYIDVAGKEAALALHLVVIHGKR